MVTGLAPPHALNTMSAAPKDKIDLIESFVLIFYFPPVKLSVKSVFHPAVKTASKISLTKPAQKTVSV